MGSVMSYCRVQAKTRTVTLFGVNNLRPNPIFTQKMACPGGQKRGTMSGMDQETEVLEVPEAVNDPDMPPDEGLGPVEVLRPRGRPRKDETPTGLTEPTQKRHVPRPKNNTYKSDAGNSGQKPKAIFTWVGGLPEWAKDKILGYVYRDWPYLKPVPEPPAGQKKTEFAYIDKITGVEMFTDETDFLNRYGCGRYRLILNEEDPRPGEGKGSKTLCTVWVNGLSNDMKSWPPSDRRVTDIAQVDLDHPDNRSYIEYLRGRGLLPNQRNFQEEEQEMAQVTAISEMTGLVKELVQNKGQNTDESNGKSMDLIADAAKRSMDMTQKAAEDYAKRTKELDDELHKRREASVAPAQAQAAQAPQESPVKLALEIVALMNQNRGSDDVLGKFMEMTNKNFERLEKIVENSLNRPLSQPTPITERVKDLRELKDMSETLWPREKDSDDVGDAVGDAAGELAPKWLRPFIPIITPLAMGLAQAFLSPRPGAPVQYPPQYPPQPQPGANPYPPPPVQFPGPVSAPGPGPQPVPTAPQSQPVNPPTGPMPVPGMPAEVANLLFMIQGPFLNMIGDPQMSGTEFAGWFQDGFGVVAHNQVIAFGPEALFTAIASYPPIANELLAARMPEKRVRDFINEFCDPKWEDEEKDKVTIIPPPPAEPGPTAS